MRARWILLPLLAVATACGGGGPATVTGDLFVVMENGAEVDVLGAPVHLLDVDARTDTALARLCASRRGLLASAATDSAREAISARAWEARTRLLHSRSRAEARTGEGARFRIEGAAPGSYRVWADAVVRRERWSWTEPVTLGGGDSLHLSLGNANADGDPFRCQLLMEIEADSAEEAR